MQDARQIEVHELADRPKLLDIVTPVHKAHAEELGAVDLLKAIQPK